MQLKGRLLQQEPNSTVGYSGSSISATRWAAQQFYVPCHTGSATGSQALSSFTNLFAGALPATVYRFEHLSRADELSDLMACGLPVATGETVTYYLPGYLSQTPFPAPNENDTGVVGQVREIVSWLGITYDELSQITGIGRSTLFHWRHTTGAPRAANTRYVERLHALTSLLVKRFGVKGAQSWLHNGPDHPWDYLIAGDVASVEDLVRLALFDQHGKNFEARPMIGGQDLPPLVTPSNPSLRRAARRPKRGRP